MLIYSCFKVKNYCDEALTSTLLPFSLDCISFVMGCIVSNKSEIARVNGSGALRDGVFRVIVVPLLSSLKISLVAQSLRLCSLAGV
ncbi:hypothetical protein T4D_299 [Trichinella pseudospiralis]|uniref:Uncharacterized protein n=1 Tax=Trichinella pseudospiralis TaxID=6337 RepID=A0A0V1G5F9_TRIPS|nr:hypothetical protein T4D_299 [Trichinella pseudospiralis]